jgi:uncharacterized protein GlcG (DUF336 family)
VRQVELSPNVGQSLWWAAASKPVRIHGQLAGAMGVAGGLSPDDGAVAKKAAAALATEH